MVEAVTQGPIFFLTGPPGVGKSTLAKALAQRFDKGVHIDIDHIRLSVVKGIALPAPGIWTEEHTLQFNLAHIAAAHQACAYADKGFAVIAEHCSHTQYIQTFVEIAPTTKVISLTADLTDNQERNALRTSTSFDYPSLAFVIEMLNESMRLEHADAGYPIVNTTGLDIESTVNQIFTIAK